MASELKPAEVFILVQHEGTEGEWDNDLRGAFLTLMAAQRYVNGLIDPYTGDAKPLKWTKEARSRRWVTETDETEDGQVYWTVDAMPVSE